MALDLSALIAAVDAEGVVIQETVTLLTDIKTKLDAALAANDTTGLQAVIDEITAHTQTLKDADAANTPS